MNSRAPEGNRPAKKSFCRRGFQRVLPFVRPFFSQKARKKTLAKTVPKGRKRNFPVSRCLFRKGQSVFEMFFQRRLQERAPLFAEELASRSAKIFLKERQKPSEKIILFFVILTMISPFQHICQANFLARKKLFLHFAKIKTNTRPLFFL